MAGSASPVWRLDRRPLDYRDGVALQRQLVRRRQRREIPDLLLLTEHPPVFTLGRMARREHLLESEDRLRAAGAEVCLTERGGDVTFHGPGQLVIYPVFDLSGWRKDLHAYLRALEGVVIEAAADLGVRARPRARWTGVWCGERKLASIGVRVSRWVASHGVAVNVSTDLRWFSRIVPCGIEGCRVTSLEREAGRAFPLGRVADRVADAFARRFDRRLAPAPPGFLEAASRSSPA